MAGCATTRSCARRSPGRSAAPSAAPPCPGAPARCRRRRRRTAPGRPASGRRSGEPAPDAPRRAARRSCRNPSSRTVVDVVPGEPLGARPPRRGRPRRRAGRARTGPRRCRAARPATRRGRAEHRHGVVPGRADDPDVAAGSRGQRDGGGAAVPRRCTARRRASGSSPGRCRPRSELVERRARGCRRTAAVFSARRRTSSMQPALDLVDRPFPVASGMRTISLPCAMPDSWLTTACQRGRCSVASLLSASTRRARGSADPQHELLEDRRAAPERLDAGDVLAGQHQVDALATGRGGRRPPAAAPPRG